MIVLNRKLPEYYTILFVLSFDYTAVLKVTLNTVFNRSILHRNHKLNLQEALFIPNTTYTN